MSATLKDTTRAALIAALAADPRRSRGGRGDSPVKEEARALRAAIQEEAAKVAAIAADRATERAYRVRVTRAHDAMRARTEAVRALTEYAQRAGWPTATGREIRADHDGHAVTRAANHYHCAECHGAPDAEGERLAYRVARRRQVVSATYGVPIDPAHDLARFEGVARSREYGVGMLALDPADIVARAIELAYLHPETLVDNGAGVMLPTVGGIYRNLKRAHRDALDMFRTLKRGGGVDYVTSLDALAEHGGDERATHYGWVESGAGDPLAALIAVEESPSFEAALVAADRAETVRAVAARLAAHGMSERAIARRLRVTVRDLRECIDASAHAERVRRVAAQRAADESARVHALTKSRVTMARESYAVPEVDRAAVAMIAAGHTVAEVASALGTHSAALVKRLRAHEWAGRVAPDTAAPVVKVDARPASVSGPVAHWRPGADGSLVRVA